MTTPLDRVTVTVPADLVKKADALARRERRSRSWVVTEALAGYLREGKPPARVAEPATTPYTTRPGLGEQRLAQLKSDLLLSPEERVREAEELAETAQLAHPRPRYRQVVLFDSLEDFFAWKKRDVLW